MIFCRYGLSRRCRQADQFDDQIWQASESLFGEAVLDREILTVDLGQLGQALAKCREEVARDRRARDQDPDAYRLNRAGERRGEEAARKRADERPSIHPSIT